MKKLMTICLVCILTAAAWGSVITTASFDENGNGSYSFDGQMTYPLIHQMFQGSPSGLGYYGFPWGPYDMTSGDVLIYEDSAQTELSDVLHFTTMGWYGGGYEYEYATVFVFSDLPEAGAIGDLADTGIPEGPYYNAVTLLEQGREGWNGVDYTPEQGQPGYVPGQNVTYAFTSDVPEPATICLLGIGALSLIRRKK